MGKAPLKGTTITSEFGANGSVSGSSGCNSYSGKYTVSGSSIRIRGPFASTNKACAAAVEAQERLFLKTLQSARTYDTSGGLMLKSSGGRLIAKFTAQTQSLAGTSWAVIGYNNGKQAVVSVLTGTKLTADFGKDGSLSGFGGCNEYHAPYKATAPKISIGPVSSTRKYCGQPAGVDDQETRYLAALETAATYTVEGNRLELRTASGALAADFHRKGK
jgi:heat shock protein HslJ